MVEKININFKEIGSNWYDIISKSSIKKCLEYSENSEELNNFLNADDLSIKIKPVGITQWSDNDMETLEIKVRIERKDNIITFPFHMSLHNTAVIFFGYGRNDNDYNYMKIILPFSKDFYTFCEKYTRIKQAKEIKEIKESLLYSILASTSCEYFIEDSFEDFCFDFGYDTDSIKTEKLHKDYLQHSKKLKSVFTEKEVYFFPS